MEILEYVKKFLSDRKIELCAAIPLTSARLLRPYKLISRGFSDTEALYAILMAVPYLIPCDKRNISAYAVSQDYHLFFSRLFGELIPLLEESFPGYKYAGFADSSPIAEVEAAALAGLGVIGKNGMLITEKYSSYVFLGEIITDCPTETVTGNIKYCHKCGECENACPKKECGECLSSLAQKKGVLDENERKTIYRYGSAWGCDVCQEVCPYTKKAIKNNTIYTELPFFYESTLPMPDSKAITDMSEDEFKKRAYSWRGRQTILRNLSILEEKKGVSPNCLT